MTLIIGGSLLVLSGIGYSGWRHWLGFQAAAEATSAAQAAQVAADTQSASTANAISDAQTDVAAAADQAAATDASNETALAAGANANEKLTQIAWQNRERIARVIVDAMDADWSSVDSQVEHLKMTVPLAHGDRVAARQLNAAGLAAMQRHNYATAIANFIAAKQADPGDIEVRNNLGDAYLQSGNLNDAFSALADTLMRSPDRSNAWQNLADVFAQGGRTDESAACVRLTLRYTRNRHKALAYLNSIVQANPSGAYPAVLSRVLADADKIPTVASPAAATPQSVAAASVPVGADAATASVAAVSRSASAPQSVSNAEIPVADSPEKPNGTLRLRGYYEFIDAYHLGLFVVVGTHNRLPTELSDLAKASRRDGGVICFVPADRAFRRQIPEIVSEHGLVLGYKICFMDTRAVASALGVPHNGICPSTKGEVTLEVASLGAPQKTANDDFVAIATLRRVIEAQNAENYCGEN